MSNANILCIWQIGIVEDISIVRTVVNGKKLKMLDVMNATKCLGVSHEKV